MPKPLKILHIIKSLGRGGAEMLLPETLRLHQQEQFEFHYIYFLPWKNQMVEALEKAGGKVQCMAAGNNFRIMTKAGEVMRYITQHQIALVHCHLPWAGFLGRYIHFWTGIPLVYTEHNKQERYHRLTYWFNRFSFDNQSHAIAVSEDVATSIRKHIAPSIPVQTILNGVNTASFRRDEEAGRQLRAQYNIPPEAQVVGTVAVFRFQKRIKEWLQVMKEVCEQNPLAYGIVVGDGPLKEDILKERERLGLEKKILMPGLQTEVRPWLSAMDIYMMSSVFEGLPIALLEAMSMECAIVSTNAGGIGEVIRHRQDGLLVGVDQWSELAAEVLQLMQNEELRKKMAQGARTRVSESFSLQRMVTELEALYGGIIAKHADS